jgi:AcrR family transcriptional regulator
VVGTTRRQDIDDAASTLFRERGYAGTSVREIARALEIQGASLYAHVTSKQEVLRSIVEHTATRFEEAADLAVLEAGGPASKPAGRIAALVRAHVGVVTEDIGRASVFVHEWRSLTGASRVDISERRDRYEQRFRSVIDEGVRSGAFGSVDPVVSAAFILSSLNGISTWYAPNGRIGPETLADEVADLVVRAVTSRGSTRAAGR